MPHYTTNTTHMLNHTQHTSCHAHITHHTYIHAIPNTQHIPQSPHTKNTLHATSTHATSMSHTHTTHHTHVPYTSHTATHLLLLLHRDPDSLMVSAEERPSPSAGGPVCTHRTPCLVGILERAQHAWSVCGQATPWPSELAPLQASAASSECRRPEHAEWAPSLQGAQGVSPRCVPADQPHPQRPRGHTQPRAHGQHADRGDRVVGPRALTATPWASSV